MNVIQASKINMVKKMEWKETINKILKFFLLVLYLTLVIALVVAPIAPAIMTLIPAQASKPNYLGYYSICSFTPFSTIILLLLIVIGVVLLVKTKPIHRVIKIFKSE